LVIGDKEQAANNVAVRKRGGKDLGSMQVKDFIEQIKKEIKGKT
jgi:threonyl-tRNA synthetase (EC 6.1.1.3)/Ser-tRNA(Thr) hydrolase (EC 3.1.1.-)